MPTAVAAPDFLFLELTGRCQMACRHCFAGSSPRGDHGSMTVRDWREVIDAAGRSGVRAVQFIGGEPTTHPALAELVTHALVAGLEVEIYTNLLRVTGGLWEVFAQPGVRLATSYYGADPARHDAVTGRRGSHARTRANIAEAVRRGIPLRVGVIDHGDREAAEADLRTLGVTDIGHDRVRAFGRAASDGADVGDTCGDCGHGTAAVLPDGTVTPCVFTRHAGAGNVRESPLGAILAGQAFAEQVQVLDQLRRPGPTACKPSPRCSPASSCGPSCTPSDTGNKGSNCQPKGSSDKGSSGSSDSE
jgi:MoaA/NifB/PqqE/SkfB family radical SAM enzyme